MEHQSFEGRKETSRNEGGRACDSRRHRHHDIMDDDDMDDDEHDVAVNDNTNHAFHLEKLLSTCDSIVQTCLSYRTLTPIVGVEPRRKPRVGGERCDPTGAVSNSSPLQLEKQVARWLDDKIFDAERSIRIMEERKARSASTTSAARTTITDDQADDDSAGPSSTPATAQELRRELLLRTSRLQLEHRYLKRALISKWVQQQYRHFESPLEDDLDSPTGAEEGTESGHLLRQATRARDRQVFEALRLEKELSDIRKQQREARDECSRLQGDNRGLWDAMHDAQLEREKKRRPTGSVGGTTPSLDVENHVLQQLLEDLVLGSSLDWFGDERLQAIVTGNNLP